MALNARAASRSSIQSIRLREEEEEEEEERFCRQNTLFLNVKKLQSTRTAEAVGFPVFVADQILSSPTVNKQT